MKIFSLHVCLRTVLSAWCPRPEEGIRYPRTEVTYGCKLLDGGWESNPGPMEEQPMLLTAKTSLQPPHTIFLLRTLCFLYMLLNLENFLQGAGEMSQSLRATGAAERSHSTVQACLRPPAWGCHKSLYLSHHLHSGTLSLTRPHF